MQEILYPLNLTILLTIAYQDFKERQVSVFLFLLLCVCGVWLNLNTTNYIDFTISTVINICFVIIQLVLLLFYFKIKKSTKSLNDLLGLGDIVFLLISSIYMGISGFIWYYVVGISLSLLIALIMNWNTNSSTIPLAGILSIELATIILLQYFKMLNLRLEFLI